jgi:hypothetical protein
MKKQDVINAWHEVFPNSLGTARSLLSDENEFCFAGYLVKDSSEAINKILNNDPLSYTVWFDDEGNAQESRLNIITKPDSKFMVYGSIKLRKKTIKAVDYDKLIKRFNEIKAWLNDNADLYHEHHKELILSKIK